MYFPTLRNLSSLRPTPSTLINPSIIAVSPNRGAGSVSRDAFDQTPASSSKQLLQPLHHQSTPGPVPLSSRQVLASAGTTLGGRRDKEEGVSFARLPLLVKVVKMLPISRVVSKIVRNGALPARGPSRRLVVSSARNRARRTLRQVRRGSRRSRPDKPNATNLAEKRKATTTP